MRTVQQISVIAMLSLFLAMGVVGCEKYRLNRDTTSSEDFSKSDYFYTEAFRTVAKAINTEDSFELRKQGTNSFACFSYSVDTLSQNGWPRELTIDFGSSNCQGPNGLEWRGKLIATLSGPYLKEGTRLDLTFDNFYLNDHQLQTDSFVIVNHGQNQQNHWEFNTKLKNGKLTLKGGDEITLNGNRKLKWVEGSQTQSVKDDVFKITGFLEGTNRNGRDFTADITQTLVYPMDCQWITKGVVKLQPHELKERTINFGDGNCDNEATVTIDNRSYTIEIGE